MDDDDDFTRRPGAAIGAACGLALVAIFGGIGLAAWYALDALEWLVDAMRGTGTCG